MALAFGARVALGMRTQLDGDEAAQAIAGVNLLHGHVVVTEPLAHYLGPFDAYVLAPFLAVGGHTLIAVRVALAVVGAAFSLAMYGLGRALFQRHRPALLLAAVAAVFPLFTVFWSAKAHETSEMLVLEATILALVICIGWRGRTHPAWWVALGAASGVALWANEESLAFLALAVLVLLMRSGALGFRKALEGMALAAVSFAVAFSPWLYHNLRTDFAALQSIPRIPATVATRFVALASSQVPILVGGSRACNQDVVPEPVTVALAIAVTLVLLWLRRKSLWHVVHGRFRDVEAADLTLLAAPLTIALLFAGGAEVLPCQPRYLIPLGIPMAVAVTLILITRSAWRIPVAMCAAAWLVVSGVTASGLLVGYSITRTGGRVPPDLGPGIAVLRSAHVTAAWAEYWLAMPLAFYAPDITVGEFGGPVGFPLMQDRAYAAEDPSWVFPSDDPEVSIFVDYCKTTGITYRTFRGGGLVVFTGLSARVEPAAAGIST